MDLVFFRFLHRVYTTSTSLSLQPSMELACMECRSASARYLVMTKVRDRRETRTFTRAAHSSNNAGLMSSSFSPCVYQNRRSTFNVRCFSVAYQILSNLTSTWSNPLSHLLLPEVNVSRRQRVYVKPHVFWEPVADEVLVLLLVLLLNQREDTARTPPVRPTCGAEHLEHPQTWSHRGVQVMLDVPPCKEDSPHWT